MGGQFIGPMVLAAVIMVQGCTKTIAVPVERPAVSDAAMRHRTVVVAAFEGDRFGSTAAGVEHFLSQVVVDRRPWFDVRRGRAGQRMRPEAALSVLNSAGMMDGAVYTGRVTQDNAADTHYTTERTRCVRRESGGGLFKKCLQEETYTVPCVKRSAAYGAVVRAMSVRTGRVLHSVAIQGQAEESECGDGISRLESKQALLNQARAQALSGLSCEFAPCIETRKLELMGSTEGLSTEQARTRFDEARKYALDSKGAGIGAACSEWTSLVNAGERTLPLFYNVATCYEINGEYQEAMDYLNRAKALSVGLVPEVEDALRRVQQSVNEKQLLDIQKRN